MMSCLDWYFFDVGTAILCLSSVPGVRMAVEGWTRSMSPLLQA